MKTFIRTVTVIVALNLATAGLAPAQNPPEEANVEAVKKEIELATLETARRAAQKIELDAREAFVLPTVPTVPRYTQAGRVLVIPAGQTKAEVLFMMMEDMSVMSRIFDTNLREGLFSRETLELTYFPNAEFWRDKTATEGIYLDDYGALFLMKVDFPLSPPTGAQEEEPVEDVDPVWEQTKQEIYSPRDARRRRQALSSKEYDAEKVEHLKRELIRTLRHATNIRKLKPEDWIIVSITGQDCQAGRVGDCANCHRSHKTESLPGQIGFLRPTVLTIRAKKSDVDAFAKGELDSDEFRQKVQILTY